MKRTSPFDSPAAAAKKSPLDPPVQGELLDRDIELPWSKGFLRTQEVAKYLDVSDDQVQRLIDAGALEAVSISAEVKHAARQHRRVTARSLRELINQRRRAI